MGSFWNDKSWSLRIGEVESSLVHFIYVWPLWNLLKKCVKIHQILKIYIKFLQCMLFICLSDVCRVFLLKQQIFISPPKIKIMTQNLQDMILWIAQGHPWCQGWRCPPSLSPGTLNVLQVPPFLTPPSWPSSSWHINAKFSGYLSWGKNIIHDTRNDQFLHFSSQEPSLSSEYPTSWPPLPYTLPIKISTQNFQGIFLRVKNILYDVRNDQVLHVSGNEPSMSSKYPPYWPPPPS